MLQIKPNRKTVLYIIILLFTNSFAFAEPPASAQVKKNTDILNSPDARGVLEAIRQKEINYGKELIVHTANYIGPKGSVGKFAGNRLSCQNCHLDAATKLFGGSFATTFTRFPSARPKDLAFMTLADRINSCIERPMKGRPLPLGSRELKAIEAYIKHLNELAGSVPMLAGDRYERVPYINRAADPKKGSIIFAQNCVQCHGQDGLGKLSDDHKSYVYPPLWGSDSFAIGSSMERISVMASFVKNNMPLGTTWEKPKLNLEEAYDVSAFVLSHKRPLLDVSKDFPNKKIKSADIPYGPYLDPFSEEQHRVGPFQPIEQFYEKLK